MPNIKILSKYTHSALLDAIQASNRMKIDREAHKRVGHSEVTSVLAAGAA